MSRTPIPYSSVVYIECDVPDGMTLTDWRRARREQGATPAMGRALRRARRAWRMGRLRIEL